MTIVMKLFMVVFYTVTLGPYGVFMYQKTKEILDEDKLGVIEYFFIVFNITLILFILTMLSFAFSI